MRKMKKKLGNIAKFFLAFGLLFNNLMPLTVVLAEEIGDDNKVVINQNADDGNNDLNDDSESGKEVIDDDTGDDETNNDNVINDDNNNDNNNNDDDDDDNDDETNNDSGNNDNDLGDANLNDNNNNDTGTNDGVGTGTNDDLDDETGESNLDDPTTGGTTGEEDEGTIEFSVNIDENDKIVIKYTGTKNLSQENKLVISEKITYLDGVESANTNEITLSDDIINALTSDSGYAADSSILSNNVFDGDYSVIAKIDEIEHDASLKIANKETGVEFSLVVGGSQISPIDGTYNIDSSNTEVKVMAKLLPGGISPSDNATIGDKQYSASQLFDGVEIDSIKLSDYLYGKFSYGVSLDIDHTNGQKDTYTDNFIIMYGTYQENTDKLNSAASALEFNSSYVFYGNTSSGVVYVLDEINRTDIESIVAKAFSNSNEISVLVDGTDVNLMDTHGVIITYSASALDDSVKIDGSLFTDNTDIKPNDEFTVNYKVILKENKINGVSGTVTYDTDLFELVGIENQQFDGTSKDNDFMYVGTESLMGDTNTDDDGNTTYDEKEYTLLKLTFRALKSGTGTVGIDDGKYYNSDVFYESLDELTLSVMVSELEDDKTLSSLVVGGQSIELQDGVFNYDIEVENDVTTIDVEAIPTSTSSKITSIVCPEELSEGENEVSVVVTAADGTSQTYKIIVTRKAVQTENDSDSETATPVNYSENNNNSNNNTVNNNTNDDKKDDQVKPADGSNKNDPSSDTTKDEGKSKLSRIIVIILILLVIAGLIYLIFKDDDDDDTKKANKDINKFKKEDIDYSSNNQRNYNNNKYNNNRYNNNNKNNNKKGR